MFRDFVVRLPHVLFALSLLSSCARTPGTPAAPVGPPEAKPKFEIPIEILKSKGLSASDRDKSLAFVIGTKKVCTAIQLTPELFYTASNCLLSQTRSLGKIYKTFRLWPGVSEWNGYVEIDSSAEVDATGILDLAAHIQLQNGAMSPIQKVWFSQLLFEETRFPAAYRGALVQVSQPFSGHEVYAPLLPHDFFESFDADKKGARCALQKLSRSPFSVRHSDVYTAHPRPYQYPGFYENRNRPLVLSSIGSPHALFWFHVVNRKLLLDPNSYTDIDKQLEIQEAYGAPVWFEKNNLFSLGGILVVHFSSEFDRTTHVAASSGLLLRLIRNLVAAKALRYSPRVWDPNH